MLKVPIGDLDLGRVGSARGLSLVIGGRSGCFAPLGAACFPIIELLEDLVNGVQRIGRLGLEAVDEARIGVGSETATKVKFAVACTGLQLKIANPQGIETAHGSLPG
jgi:hypothetical protein